MDGITQDMGAQGVSLYTFLTYSSTFTRSCSSLLPLGLTLPGGLRSSHQFCPLQITSLFSLHVDVSLLVDEATASSFFVFGSSVPISIHC